MILIMSLKVIIIIEINNCDNFSYVFGETPSIGSKSNVKRFPMTDDNLVKWEGDVTALSMK